MEVRVSGDVELGASPNVLTGALMNNIYMARTLPINWRRYHVQHGTDTNASTTG